MGKYPVDGRVILLGSITVESKNQKILKDHVSTIIMDDLRQLLRYEIPGLVTILYFLMLSHPFLLDCARQYNICLDQILELSLELAGTILVLALPIGFLVYQLYTTVEHENFLRSREGIKLIKRTLYFCFLSL